MTPLIFGSTIFNAVLLCLAAGVLRPAVQDAAPPHETFRIPSKHVQETRVICVWTPPNYSMTDDAYPVLYMPDGGIREDFPHIANTIAKLLEQRQIAPLILVGIENTQRRRDLTGPSSIAADAEIAPITDGASKFRAFIRDELFPEVARRYRVTDKRAIVGESAAGLFIVETLLLKPEMFDVYIAMDPAIYWNDQYLVRTAGERLESFGKQDLRFWFAASDTIDIAPHTQKLASVLADRAPQSLKWKYSPQPNERHNTIFRATKEAAFRWALWPNASQQGK